MQQYEIKILSITFGLKYYQVSISEFSNSMLIFTNTNDYKVVSEIVLYK